MPIVFSALTRNCGEHEEPLYQSNLSPNCTWRDEVDVPVINPPTPEDVGVVEPGASTATIRLGVLKLVRFSRLKISARNCKLIRSWSCVSFMTEKSQLPSPGPMKVSRPRFPKKPLLFGTAANAAGLNHSLGLPTITGPLKLGLTNGRTGLRVSPSFEGL
jgi:hypothetical protein